MPRLWNETIEAHRHEVRHAILDATWALVNERGLTSVTMSQVAQRTGIGRATLYKYFPDIETILLSWHDLHTTEHLERLVEISNQPGPADQRLDAVLHAYGLICHRRERHAPDLVALLHREGQTSQTQHRLHELVEKLLTEVAGTGALRDELTPGELASYCLHALTAAGDLLSEEAVDRLVMVTRAALRPTEKWE